MLPRIAIGLRKFKRAFSPVMGEGVKPVPRQLREALTMLIRCQLTPDEYYQYGFYRQNIDYENMVKYLSRYNSLHVMRPLLNNQDWGELFQNKLLFNIFMKENGLPVSNIYGYFDFRWGYTAEGAPLRSIEDLASWLTKHKPKSLVLKPLRGCQGRGVLVFSKVLYRDEGVVFYNPLGEACSLSDIEKQLSRKYKVIGDYGYILEEYLEQHELINPINPTSLNTLRVVTLLQKNEEPLLHLATLRIGRRNKWLNNVSQGGVWTRLDLQHGIIGEGLVGTDHTSGYISEHPDSKVRFAGLKLPFWQETVSLCRKAASLCPFCRDLGWDIAITAEGPVLVEGSHVHDIIIQKIGGGMIQPKVAEKLAELGYYHPIDRLPQFDLKAFIKAAKVWTKSKAYAS